MNSDLGWWSVPGEDIYRMLQLVAAGGDPEEVYAAERDAAQSVMRPAKPCTKCRVVKPLTGFKLIHSKPESWCGSCRALAIRDWAVRHPESRAATARRSQLKAKYGLTETDYDAMFEAQHGVCASCGKRETALIRGHGKEKVSRLSVDHNHSTGQVRGLLCQACNRALGLMHEDPDVLRRLAQYIEHHNADVNLRREE